MHIRVLPIWEGSVNLTSRRIAINGMQISHWIATIQVEKIPYEVITETTPRIYLSESGYGVAGSRAGSRTAHVCRAVPEYIWGCSMLYDRKIKYLDYMENGIKVGGGGFAKLELRNGKFRLHLQVSGLHGTDSFLRDVILLTDTGESGLGQMELKEGAGSFRYEGSLEKGIGQTDARYEELQGIKIPISNTREIRCIWGKEPGRAERDQTGQDRHREKAGTDQRTGTEAGAMPDRQAQLVPEREPAVQGTSDTGSLFTRKKKREPDSDRTPDTRPAIGWELGSGKGIAPGMQPAADSRGEKGTEEAAISGPEEEAQEARGPRSAAESRPAEEPQPAQDLQMVTHARTAENIQKRQDQRMVPSPQTEQGKKSPRPVKLLEDKWQQLSAIYPHVQPFKDERDYLSIRPSDFVLLPAKSYQAAKNSFLLHGYYNYHHLILARMEKRGEVTYYLGVPGNYYPKEKQVAVMFGFESFESGQEPAQAGDFGYYMMRTDL